MKKEIRNQLFYLFLFIFFLIIGFSILTLSIFVVSTKRNQGRDDESVATYNYKYFSINRKTKEKAVGITTLSQELEIDENVKYYDEFSENDVIISNIGTKVYECTGSCYCSVGQSSSDDIFGDRRFSSSQVLVNGMKFLIASTTSLIAFSKAKDFFDEECRTAKSEECPPSSTTAIISETDSCVEILDLVPSEKDSKILESGSEEEDDGESYRFLCKGECQPDFTLHEQDKRIDQFEGYERVLDFKCEHVKYELVINVKKEEDEETSQKKNDIITENAVLTFSKKYLDPFCKAFSRVPYLIFEPKWETVEVVCCKDRPLSVECVRVKKKLITE